MIGRKLSEKVILKELRKIVDPELNFNIVDLGYINKIEINGGDVKIFIVLTTPLCPYAGYIFQMVEGAVKKIKGVRKVELEYDWEHPWSPEKMKPEIRKKLGI